MTKRPRKSKTKALPEPKFKHGWYCKRPAFTEPYFVGLHIMDVLDDMSSSERYTAMTISCNAYELVEDGSIVGYFDILGDVSRRFLSNEKLLRKGIHTIQEVFDLIRDAAVIDTLELVKEGEWPDPYFSLSDCMERCAYFWASDEETLDEQLALYRKNN